MICNERYCFSCGKQINKLFNNIGKCIHPENDNWDNATVEVLNPGYGSKFDGNVYIISICDDCIEKNIDRLDYRFKSA